MCTWPKGGDCWSIVQTYMHGLFTIYDEKHISRSYPCSKEIRKIQQQNEEGNYTYVYYIETVILKLKH